MQGAHYSPRVKLHCASHKNINQNKKYYVILFEIKITRIVRQVIDTTTDISGNFRNWIFSSSDPQLFELTNILPNFENF